MNSLELEYETLASERSILIRKLMTENDPEKIADLQKRMALVEERFEKLSYVLYPDEMAERDFERRAAFGPGVTVVNVLTGKKSKT